MLANNGGRMRPAALLSVCFLSLVATPDGPKCCQLLGDDVAELYRVESITQRRFDHDLLWRALLPLDGVGGVVVTDVGRSIQGRAIRAVTFGTGPVRVLLWSQMHGDE